MCRGFGYDISVKYSGEYWLTGQGDSITAFGKGGHTGAAEFCLTIDTPDTRLSAIQQGWKRLEGLNVETWQLAQTDCEAIQTGLKNIYGSDVEYQLVNVYVYSTRHWYVQIPFPDVRPQKIRRYEMR